MFAYIVALLFGKRSVMLGGSGLILSSIFSLLVVNYLIDFVDFMQYL